MNSVFYWLLFAVIVFSVVMVMYYAIGLLLYPWPKLLWISIKKKYYKIKLSLESLYISHLIDKLIQYHQKQLYEILNEKFNRDKIILLIDIIEVEGQKKFHLVAYPHQLNNDIENYLIEFNACRLNDIIQMILKIYFLSIGESDDIDIKDVNMISTTIEETAPKRKVDYVENDSDEVKNLWMYNLDDVFNIIKTIPKYNFTYSVKLTLYSWITEQVDLMKTT